MDCDPNKNLENNKWMCKLISESEKKEIRVVFASVIKEHRAPRKHEVMGYMQNFGKQHLVFTHIKRQDISYFFRGSLLSFIVSKVISMKVLRFISKMFLCSLDMVLMPMK
jgi:hypothetical protein